MITFHILISCSAPKWFKRTRTVQIYFYQKPRWCTGLETKCYAVTYLANRVDLGPLPNVLTVLNGSSIPPDLRPHGLPNPSVLATSRPLGSCLTGGDLGGH